MIPNINPNNNLQPNPSNFPVLSAPASMAPAIAALNQEPHEAPPLIDRVSKKSRTDQPTWTVHYPPDDTRVSYEGEMLNGKYHGHGFLLNRDGSSYRGEFKDSLRHGKGIHLYGPAHPLASTEGEFVNDCPVNATILLKNGAKYTGELKDSLRHGKGIHIYAPSDRTTIRMEGEFARDEPVNVTIWFKDGAIYSGFFKNWLFDGQGTFISPDKTLYFGEFKDGKRSGLGNVAYPDGTKYSGEFKDDKKNGWGALTGKSGHYEGLWLNNDMDSSNNKYRENIQKLP
jgi:hypothetical protein